MKRLMGLMLLFALTTIPAFAQFGNATRIQSRPMAATAPTDTQTICWDNTAKTWKPCAGGSGISACSTTPPTTGTPNSFCYDTSNALWKCSNGASACTIAGQWVAQGGGSGMTWPATPGIGVCTGTPCTAWGTSITGLSQALVGYLANVTSDIQAQLNARVNLQSSAPGTQQTGNINISGVVEADGGFSTGLSAALLLQGLEEAAPTVTTPTVYLDSTAHIPQYLNASSVKVGTMVAPESSATSNEVVDYITTAGVAHKAYPTVSVFGTTCTSGTSCTPTVPLANGGTGVDLSAAGGAVNTTGAQVLHENASHVISSSAIAVADLPMLTVPYGGTGLATLTAHAVQVGEATSTPAQVGPNAATTYPLFSAGRSADPAFRAIAAGDIPWTAVPPPALPTPGSTCSLSAPGGYCVCTTTCTVTLFAPAAAGDQVCLMNDVGVSTGITVAGITNIYFSKTDRSAYGSASAAFTGTAGAGLAVCLVARDTTHWVVNSFNGTWTP